MSDPKDTSEPTWSDVLAVLRRAIAESSLRQVARNLDMAPNGVTKMLNGAIPRASTHRKLVEWYIRYLPTVRTATPAWLEAVLGPLAAAFPVDRQEHAKDRLRGELARLHREERIAIPRWLAR